jgi:hypothetical protein
MDFARGMLSAILLTVWAASVGLFLWIPTSPGAFLLAAVTTIACVGWWLKCANDSAKHDRLRR